MLERLCRTVMKICISDIPKEGLQFTFSGNEDILSAALGKINLSHGLNIDPRISGYIHVSAEDDHCLVSGEASGTMHMLCSRCLQDFSLDKNVSIAVTVRTRDEQVSMSQELEAEQNTFFIDGLEFDPGEIILQEFLLEVPMKPLCREDCSGLCPKCGNALDVCKCSPEDRSDPRWEKLKQLREKLPD
jgi:uncharacterized protein